MLTFKIFPCGAAFAPGAGARVALDLAAMVDPGCCDFMATNVVGNGE